jgi:hypothetical protein
VSKIYESQKTYSLEVDSDRFTDATERFPDSHNPEWMDILTSIAEWLHMRPVSVDNITFNQNEDSGMYATVYFSLIRCYTCEKFHSTLECVK